MGSLFGSPSIPAPTRSLKPPATQVDPAVIAARDRERKMRALQSGRHSTMLTGPRGVTSPTRLATPTLIGG